MNTISAEELRSLYPKTWNEVHSHGSKFRSGTKQINIRIFLERQGYSLSCVPVIDSNKWIPSINYDGTVYEVDNRRFRFSDFSPMSLKKALQEHVLYALQDYENNRYNIQS